MSRDAWKGKLSEMRTLLWGQLKNDTKTLLKFRFGLTRKKTESCRNALMRMRPFYGKEETDCCLSVTLFFQIIERIAKNLSHVSSWFNFFCTSRLNKNLRSAA